MITFEVRVRLPDGTDQTHSFDVADELIRESPDAARKLIQSKLGVIADIVLERL